MILVQLVARKITTKLAMLQQLAGFFSSIFFGLFNQDKLLPLRYCPIQIELELVNSFIDAIVIRDANGFALWNISDIQCKCDLLTLDNTLDNEYASHLLAGKSLPTY